MPVFCCQSTLPSVPRAPARGEQPGNTGRHPSDGAYLARLRALRAAL